MLAPPSPPLKLIYITGAGRSGSTVLGAMLGQIASAVYVGELLHIGDKSIGQNTLCGCGAPMRECSLWSEVCRVAYGDMDRALAALHVRRNYGPVRNAHLMLPGRLPKYLESLGSFRQDLAALHYGIAQATGKHVIVDSSHVPLYGAVLASLEGIDVYAIHLVRDARAVAWSWMRKKVHPDHETPWEMARHRPWKTTALWCASNVMVERLFRRRRARYMFLRYEDLIAAPRHTIQRILQFVEEPLRGLRFPTENSVELETTHTVFGNPDRFKTGQVPLRVDDEWRQKMQTADQAAVLSLAWPQLLKYGYLLRRQRTQRLAELPAEATA